MNVIKENQEKFKPSLERINFLENELFFLKNRMAEVLNIVMEFGGADLLDQLEDIISTQTSTNENREEKRLKSVFS